MAVKKKPGAAKARRVKPLRAHDHIKKTGTQAQDTIVESAPKFHPRSRVASTTKRHPKLAPKKEKKMAQTSAGATEHKAVPRAASAEAPPTSVDPRIMQVVIALMPAASAEEHKKVAEAVQKLFDAAAQK